MGSGQLWSDIQSGARWVGDKVDSGVNSVKKWFGSTFGGGSSPGDPDWNGGFNSFRKLKDYLGDPGKGNVYHHIVEQSQIKNNRAGFDATWVHNVNNVVKVSNSMNQTINRFYSGKQDIAGFVNTGSQTFRDWITTKSFQEQYEWGIKVLNYFGVDV